MKYCRIQQDIFLTNEWGFKFGALFASFKPLSFLSSEKRLNVVAASAQNPEFVSHKDEGLEACRQKLFTLIVHMINLSEIYTNFWFLKYLCENFFARHSAVSLQELEIC